MEKGDEVRWKQDLERSLRKFGWGRIGNRRAE